MTTQLMTTQLLFINKISDVEFEVLAKYNSKYMGRFVMDIDGYFYYEDTNKFGGYQSSEYLRELAESLEAINKPHDDMVRRELDEYKNRHTALYGPTLESTKPF